jgi:hypothetical protein
MIFALLVGLALVLHGPSRVAAEQAGPHIDLHSHLSGAISGARLYRIGVRHDIAYPVKLLASVGISVPKRYQRTESGEASIHMRALDRLLAPKDRQRLVRAMSASNSDFETFRRVYRLRDPFTKKMQLMPDILMGIGQEAKKAQVAYLELSAGSMLSRPEQASMLKRAVTDVEHKTGVQLRFLLSFDRHAPVADNVRKLESARKAGLLDKGAPIVGIDIKGHETNSILEQAELIQAAAQLRSSGARPDFQVRVHAGETPHHPRNVEHAVRLGATRIGHGLYGMNSRTIKLIETRGVIVEVNPTSNQLLGFKPATVAHPLHRLLRRKVRVTVSTDGAGTFRTTPASELDKLSRELKLTDKQKASVLRSNASYLRGMSPRAGATGESKATAKTQPRPARQPRPVRARR